MRSKKFFYNTISSLVGQFVAMLCGMILPRVMLAGFGSELYGATTSIAEFLGYIALLEGGIGGVARAALYKPLAEQDSDGISQIIASVKQFFQKLAFLFIGYTLVIACTYQYIASEYNFDWSFTFCLVFVISFSTLAEYYWGITNSMLLQADQRGYITKLLQSLTTLLNTVLTCILIYLGCSILTVKLAYCFLHILRIFFLNMYVKKHYFLKKLPAKKGFLKQKWDCLGQHIAFFLHSKTDVFVLTIFVNLREVAVYSIYNYITTSLVTLASSFISGAEAVFGNMLAKNEKDSLRHFFDLAEFIIHTIGNILFSTAAIMIMPFIQLYTAGISDAEYYRPEVAFLMLLAEGIYCLRQPYHQITIAAGAFKSTRNAAFTEAGLNILLSCILVKKFGIAGVAAATVIAMTSRTIYYICYLTNNIINRSFKKFLKRWIITGINISTILLVFKLFPLLPHYIKNYIEWTGIAFMVICISTTITGSFSFIFYRQECKQFIEMFLHSIKKIFRK